MQVQVPQTACRKQQRSHRERGLTKAQKGGYKYYKPLVASNKEAITNEGKQGHKMAQNGTNSSFFAVTEERLERGYKRRVLQVPQTVLASQK